MHWADGLLPPRRSGWDSERSYSEHLQWQSPLGGMTSFLTKRWSRSVAAIFEASMSFHSLVM